MADRWKTFRATSFWLMTSAWVVALGWTMGALLALQSPESDRAPLVLLLAGPPLFALLQPLAASRPRATFVRTALLTLGFLTPLVVLAGSRMEAMPAWLIAGYAVGCGLIGMFLSWLATLLRRLMRRPGSTRPLSMQGDFAFASLGAGGVLVGLGRLFLWRARVTRPEFDPVEYPNAYSRAMDWWTYGFLAIAALAGLWLVWLALRVHSPGNITED